MLFSKIYLNLEVKYAYIAWQEFFTHVFEKRLVMPLEKKNLIQVIHFIIVVTMTITVKSNYVIDYSWFFTATNDFE